MTLALLTVFVISVAMATGFLLGRIWQMRHDLEQQLEAGRERIADTRRKGGGDPVSTVTLHRHLGVLRDDAIPFARTLFRNKIYRINARNHLAHYLHSPRLALSH